LEIRAVLCSKGKSILDRLFFSSGVRFDFSIKAVLSFPIFGITNSCKVVLFASHPSLKVNECALSLFKISTHSITHGFNSHLSIAHI
jgi:hypothetical protein